MNLYMKTRIKWRDIVVLLFLLHGSKASLTYIGCFLDGGGNLGRDLGDQSERFASNSMTIEICIQHCKDMGRAYAGAELALECWCGNSYGSMGPATNCDYACTGDPTQICGGMRANSVYRVEPAQSWYTMHKGRRLAGHVISSMMVQTDQECAAECTANFQCKSFNFLPASSECELKSAGNAAMADASVEGEWMWWYTAE